jgi:hypothetical protein
MRNVARAAALAVSILAAALFTSPAWAVTPEEVIARYQGTYIIFSVTVSSTDPTVYEMVASAGEGPIQTILVDVATGDIITAEEPGPGPLPEPGPVVAADPASKDECKEGGWEGFSFRNQGQCIRFVNTGGDTREDSSDDDDEGGEVVVAEATGEECRGGGWEALGFRNQGQCLRELAD